MNRRAATAALGALLLVGCGAPGPEESETIADDMRVEVHETVRTVVEGLRERGIEVTEATGSYSACGLKTPEVEYGAGLTTTPESGSLADQAAAATEVIESLGLPMDDDGPENYVSTDPAEGALRVSAQETPVEPGVLAIEVVRDCEELDAGVVDERLSEDAETID